MVASSKSSTVTSSNSWCHSCMSFSPAPASTSCLATAETSNVRCCRFSFASNVFFLFFERKIPNECASINHHGEVHRCRALLICYSFLGYFCHEPLVRFRSFFWLTVTLCFPLGAWAFTQPRSRKGWSGCDLARTTNPEGGNTPCPEWRSRLAILPALIRYNRCTSNKFFLCSSCLFP